MSVPIGVSAVTRLKLRNGVEVSGPPGTITEGFKVPGYSNPPKMSHERIFTVTAGEHGPEWHFFETAVAEVERTPLLAETRSKTAA